MQNERKVVELNLSDVLPNRFQPRIKFDENAINELALSIQKYGVIQPIVVRQIGNKYEIIAGERRYKASKVAGKQTIPAIISELNDKDSVEIALIENVQREDLTPIEKAVSYKKILDMGYINQEELAKKVGKSQSAIANTLRLLNLSDDVQEALLENKISERHARSLLKLKNEKQQVEMLNRIIKERLTVRKTDEEIDKMLNEELNKPEEVVQIPDSAINEVNNPGFMNIDAIEQNAQDIIKPERPVANVDQLLKSNAPVVEEQPQHQPTGKFFNFFDQPVEQKNNEDNFKLENFFTNMDNTAQSNTTSNQATQAPSFEAPSMPEVPQATQVPSFEAPSMPEVPQATQAPSFDIPSMPEVPQATQVPSFEAPSMPEVPQATQVPSFEAPSMPEVPQATQVPSFDIPSMPEVPQATQAQTFNAPSMPKVHQTSQTTAPIYDVPIAPTTTDIPVIDQPIEPSLNVGNINVETFTKPVNNVSEITPTPTIKAAVPNIKVALNTIRECESTLEKYGFTVDVEEIDFEDSYQVIFKIEK